MKLYSWKMRRLYGFGPYDGNFGDELNAWLWPKLLPNLFNNDDSEIFLGIGTLINNLTLKRLPHAQKIHVFGTGVGLGDHLQNLPTINGRWNIQWLRGPLSARALNLDTSYALADGALLVSKFIPPSTAKKYRYSFMPHIYQARSGALLWKKMCRKLDIHYIDPRSPVEEILHAIADTEILITEALHGAIVAEALRVPWIPVTSSKKIYAFKWEDWCASIGLTYSPFSLQHITYASIVNIKKMRSIESQLGTLIQEKGILADQKHIESLVEKMYSKLITFNERHSLP